MKRAIKAFVILVIIVMIGEMFGKNDNKQQNQSQTEQTEQADPMKKITKKTKSIVKKSLNSTDLEDYIGKDYETTLDKIKDEEEYRGHYEFPDGKITLTSENGDKITSIEIDNTTESCYHGIKCGMDVEEIKKLLSDDYQYNVQKEQDIYFWKTPEYEESDYGVNYTYKKGGIISLNQNNVCESIVGREDEQFNNDMQRYKEQMNNGLYVEFDSIYRALEDADIKDWSTEDKQLAINEIYAREGMKFSDLNAVEYFTQKPWYEGKIDEDKFDKDKLSDIEKYNIKFLQESIQTDKERFKQEEEEANKVTIQDVLGTFKDEDKGYKLIISVDEDNTLIDTTRVKYQIYQKDYSLYAEGEADFIDETISGADYDFIINEDKSITVKFKFGEEIGTFEKV